MRILCFDCGMGAAGDMLSAALYELLPDQTKAKFIEIMNALLPGVRVSAEPAKKCGILGTKFRVFIRKQEEGESAHAGHPHASEAHEHEHAHHHGKSLDEIRHVLSHLNIPDSVCAHAQAVYRLIADAESTAHGMPVEQIHFHEVGELDAVADIVATCLLIDLLKPDQIFCTPVHVGAGHVRCAHGILPVPAPATALLLRGVPIYGGAVQGELCTPTGAALLKHFCLFDRQPVFAPQAIGYGMGTKDFEMANCVRAMLGETVNSSSDTIAKLCCNLDDMTPEAIGFAIERLWETAVLDVYTIPIGMKKGRPGTMLCCLCKPEDAESVTAAILRHTSTLGVREHACSRTTLERRMKTIPSASGDLHIKESFGLNVKKQKVEYEDAARVAREQDIPLHEAIEQILRQANERKNEHTGETHDGT